MDDGATLNRFRTRLAFAVRVLRADLGNFFIWQFRDVDAFLVSGKNSGTHWVKFMLSLALAHHAGVAPPTYASGPSADTVIAHPRWRKHPNGLPFIGSTHSIPSIAFSWRMKLFRPPPVVVLVREIRDALLSNYVKWRGDYALSLADYIRIKPLGRKLVADAWWYIHFFNRWGDIATAWPDRILIVHYENIRAEPALWLTRIAAHCGVTLQPDDLAEPLQYTDRAAMSARMDPADAEIIIPEASLRSGIELSASDEAYLAELFRRYLRHDLGYVFSRRSGSTA